MAKQNKDNPQRLEKMLIKEMYRPFSARSFADKSNALNSLPAAHPKKILDACFEEIFLAIDNDKKYQGFYSADHDKRMEILNELIKIEAQKIEDVKQPISFPNTSESDEDEEAEAQQT